MSAYIPIPAQSRLKKAEETDSLVKRVLPNVAEIQSFTKEGVSYHVLIGASLSVDSRASGAVPQRVQITVPATGDLKNIYVSSRSIITAPYRVAVACTCPDWLIRGGLEFAPGECPELSNIEDGTGDIQAAERSQEFRDAGQGCKHMMLCNASLLHVQPITLGPERRNTMKLGMYWKSKPKRKLGAPYQITESRLKHTSELVDEAI